jgi:hypothetical protein
MGLDVYVGCLTRYYAGDWQTVVEQAALEGAADVLVVGRPPPVDVHHSRLMVQAWQKQLNAELRQQLRGPLRWDEGPECSYFTDKPDWDGYLGLLLLAAHVENPHLPMPAHLPQPWDADPAWIASNSNGAHGTRFHHLIAAEWWLPADFDEPLQTRGPAGEDAWVGSSTRLLMQLTEVNRHTFNASDAELAHALRAGASPGDSFQHVARFGLAVFLSMSALSVAHALPMRLDY